MRSFIKMGLVIAAMAGTLAAGIASAEVRDVRELNVPFAFDVNGKAMPAGHYRVERLANPSVVMLRNEAGEGIFVTTQVPEEDTWDTSTALTFTRSAEGYALSTIAGNAVLSTK